MSYLPEPNSTLQLSLSSRHLATIVIEAFIDAFIGLLALIGNILVLIIIYRKPSLRTIPNYFVVALALSDIAMAIFVKPLSIITISNGSWVFNYEICQIQGYICVFLSSFSLNILTLMAINRYFKIVQSKLHRKYFSSQKTYVFIVFAVLIAVFSGLPYTVAGYSYEFHAGKYFCYQRKLLWSTLYLMCIFLGFPTGIIIICYLKVFLTIRHHTKNAKRSFQRSFSHKITVEEIRITKTLFATVVAFLLCWMPVFVVEMIDLTQEARLPRQVYVMFTLCASASSTVNPIIYGIMNKSFRKEYQDILRTCGIKIDPGNRPAEESNVNIVCRRSSQRVLEVESVLGSTDAQQTGIEIVEGINSRK